MTGQLALQPLSRNQLSHRCRCCLWCNSVLEVFLSNREISVWFVPVRIIHQAVPSETGVWRDVKIMLTVAVFETHFNMVNSLTKLWQVPLSTRNCIFMANPDYAASYHRPWLCYCLYYVRCPEVNAPILFSASTEGRNVRLQMKQIWRVQNLCTKL
jgi:hypothetical protein